MKRIVTGIDFSKTSVLAFRYAMHLAKKTGSELLLVNVQRHLDYEVPTAAGEPGRPEHVMKQFEELVAKHQTDDTVRIFSWAPMPSKWSTILPSRF